ncbi:hypothetical protein [Pseudomonas sp. FEN]|nr:hypothetical protein [Pseudomonas sp. FEN]
MVGGVIVFLLIAAFIEAYWSSMTQLAPGSNIRWRGTLAAGGGLSTAGRKERTCA